MIKNPGSVPPAGRVDLDADPYATATQVGLTATGELPAESNADAAPSPLPRQIGRYRIERVLGRGGFGIVYLAYDEQLERSVAVKVPNPSCISRPEDAARYLSEARLVANLAHPHIVPVYDVGSTDEIACYVVSQFIDGETLADRIARSRPPWHESVELVATVAEALHFAHKQGVVHRDMKPGNILIAHGGQPYVVDFGLALRDRDSRDPFRYAGTPAYMSPEQARGEGHRVDGRSDVFSLGVVLYELLVGRRPFHGETPQEMVEDVANADPKPPRQIDDQLPKELERICLKALAKRATERYTTARDFADDLRRFLGEMPTGAIGSATASPWSGLEQAPGAVATASTATKVSASHSHAMRIVPKGLRSFDAHDADFFLELLPGPRDRDGLPESVRFWKTRIEETVGDQTFSVGLIYGPSGCGKSSLMKAGLLPRLSHDVVTLYLEAAADGTESRLLSALRKRWPDLPASLGLKDSLAALRRGEAAPTRRKLLLVIDQFEQWLHSRQEDQYLELVQALRQCDGARVQCILLVRDDFWMAVTRFLRELEIDLIPGENTCAVDLFDLDHARKVLAAFGRAHGRLPENSDEMTREQREYLNRVVTGLSEEGKVISVRLALFAEMMKGRPWTRASLLEVGGTEGVGVTFLEETFSAASAHPGHRLHQSAARAVLSALLPESGTDLKGHMRSYDQLLEASGYTGRPHDFEELIRILDREIRLITPVEVEGTRRYFQLTHDYLVASLRDWLTQKRQETRRGRAELRLADRAAAWTARPEDRVLPSLFEFLNIRLLTDRCRWTEPQRRMMRRAARLHFTLSSLAAMSLAVVAVTGLAIGKHVDDLRERDYAESLVERLITADIEKVPEIVEEVSHYRHSADPLLIKEFDSADPGSPGKLHAALALLAADKSKVPYLVNQLLEVRPAQFSVVLEALRPYQDSIVESLWDAAINKQSDLTHQHWGGSMGFQAACALAAYAPYDERWYQISPWLARELVKLDTSSLIAGRDALRPVRGKLLEPLSAIYRDSAETEQIRTYAAEALADYFVDQPATLLDLLADAEQFQFSRIYGGWESGYAEQFRSYADLPSPERFKRLSDQHERLVSLAEAELQKSSLEDADFPARARLAQRKANVAVALLKLDAPDHVWPLLRHSPDPRTRSRLIHSISSLGIKLPMLLKRFDVEADVAIRRALLLAIGEYSEPPRHFWATENRPPMIESLLALVESDPDPGIHAAAEWLLHQWNRATDLKAVVHKLRTDERQLRSRPAVDARKWYVNGEGQTFVILDAAKFSMGSALSDPDRKADEVLHARRIDRTFAVAAKEVTREQYQRFLDDESNRDVKRIDIDAFSRTIDSPQVSVDWYVAARYCNWLSRVEGISPDQWCYEPNSAGEYAEGMRPAANFLQRTGYRLPTEAEWEFASRAGSETSRYFGGTAMHLPNYAWFQDSAPESRAQPCGRLKPNDFGLFDTLGNAAEWCHDTYGPYPSGDADRVSIDTGDQIELDEKHARVLRGGSFYLRAALVRCANRLHERPGSLLNDMGLRPARTFLP